MENYELKEKERTEKIERMFKLADDVGSGAANSPIAGEMWFETWQDALDFKSFCEENGLEVRLVEADPKPVTMSGRYYRVWPK